MKKILLTIILVALLGFTNQAHADITTGLTSYWNFNEGSGTTATDSAGSNTGTLTNGPTWTAGKIGSGALSFDGTSAYVSASSGIIGSSAATACAWIYPANLTGYSASIVDNHYFSFYVINDSQNNVLYLRISNDSSGNGGSSSVNSIVSGQWQHVCATRDASGLGNLYVNGSLSGTANQPSGTPAASPYNTYIGAYSAGSSGANFFSGSIDDVRIYNRALSAGDISELYSYIGGTPPSSDTTAPSIPSNLSATAVSQSSINLTWTASTDAVGVSGYKIYRGGTQVGTATTNSYSDSGLTASTAYLYTVSAYDASGNTSSQSSSASATTQAASVDTTAPVISSITSSAVTSSSATVSFSTDEISDTQVEYGLTTSYGSQTALNTSLVTSHSQSITGLTANTLYNYRVKSKDAAGNLSTSGNNTFTTAAVASTYTLSVTKSGSGTGTVTGGSVNCGSTCTQSSISSGTSITLTATPTGGSTFTGWGGSCSGTGSCAVIVSSDTTVTAAFTAATGGVSITAATGNATDVQSAINSITSGGTVSIPAGTWTWNNPVTISGKAVKLQGAGAGRVVARSASSNSIGLGSKTFVLTNENVASIAALRSAITNGITLKMWRTGGEISNGEPTGAIPWMRGTVTSISGNTLTMNITSVGGSGTHPVWIITTEANTTILDNVSNNSVLKITEDTSSNTEISGIRFEHAPGLSTSVDTSANFIEINNTNGGQPVFIHDNFFLNYTYGNQILSHTNKGVIWSSSFVSLPVARGPLAIHTQAQGISNSWTTASTMGTNDTTGKGNLYTEDSDFHAWQNATDYDDNARATMRYNLFDNAGFGTHGADSSVFGQRHFEVYNSEFFRNNYSDGQTINITQFFLIRGGTGVIADNIIPAFTGSDYGGAPGIKLALWNLQCNCGPNPLWGSGISGIQYPLPRQVGRGYVNGTSVDGKGRNTDSMTFVGDLEPLYIWGNTGGYNVVLSEYTTPSAGQDVIADYIVAGRDYYNNSTPKPNYVKYPYPHPLRTGASPVVTPPPSDTTAPTTPASLTSSSITSGGATISWTASTDAVGVTGYKIYRGGTQIGTSVSTTYTDSGLTASTLYSYTVAAYDAAGNTSNQSTALPVTTSAAPVADTTLPTISITAPTNGSTVSGSSVSIAATASDNIGVVGVQFKLDGTNLGSELTVSPYSGTWNTTSVSNGSHSLTAIARDAAGNTKTSTGVTVTVSNSTADATPPSTPTGITSSSVTQTGITLSWLASVDTVGVSGYKVFRNGTLIASPLTNTYAVTGLTASTLYTFTVSAYDAAGNNSSLSLPTSVTTASVPVTTYTVSATKSGTGTGTISGNGISCGSTCSASITNGTTVTLTATPSADSTFTGWGGACTGTGSCTTTVTGAKSVSAVFTLVTSGSGSSSSGGGGAPVTSASSTGTLTPTVAQSVPVVSKPTVTACSTQTVTTSGTAFTRSLTVGSTGNDVKALQQFLNIRGFYVSLTGVGSKGNESTYFGPATAKAVAKFQLANGILPSSGLFGPITMKKVNSMLGTSSTVPCTTTPTVTTSSTYTRSLTIGSTGNDVKALQIFLNTHGFPVSTSGVGSRGLESTYFGPATTAALARFQASKGIVPAAGYFGPVTMKTVMSIK